MREDCNKRWRLSAVYSEIQHLRHQEEIHCLNRHILAHFLPQRTDGRFAVEVGGVEAQVGASSELSGVVSLLLETSPFQKHVPRHTFPAICCRKSFSHQMSLHAALVSKENKTGSQVAWKTAYLSIFILVFDKQAALNWFFAISVDTLLQGRVLRHLHGLRRLE